MVRSPGNAQDFNQSWAGWPELPLQPTAQYIILAPPPANIMANLAPPDGHYDHLRDVVPTIYPRLLAWFSSPNLAFWHHRQRLYDFKKIEKNKDARQSAQPTQRSAARTSDVLGTRSDAGRPGRSSCVDVVRLKRTNRRVKGLSLNRSQKRSALLSTTPRLRTRSSTNDLAPLRRMWLLSLRLAGAFVGARQ